MRTKSVVLGSKCSFFAHESVYLGTLTQGKSPGPKIYVDYQKISMDYLENSWRCLRLHGGACDVRKI